MCEAGLPDRGQTVIEVLVIQSWDVLSTETETLKHSFCAFKPISSIGYFDKSNHLKHSYNHSDWPKLACLIKVQSTVLTAVQFSLCSL